MPTQRPHRRRQINPELPLADLLESFEIWLHSERKAKSTVRSYCDGVRIYLAWCAENGHPAELDRDLIAAWTAEMLADGNEPTTARARQLGVRRFSSWLADQGEIDVDPLLGIKSPKLDTKVVASLSDDELRLLIKACSGKSFRDRRDEALVRFMAETGARAGETVALQMTDVDLVRGVATVVRGKGGKGRTVPFGPQTATALDRYKRARRLHSLAASPSFWLGDRGHVLGYYGLRHALRRRSSAAGLVGFHPHQLRHTAASRWLAAGGSEGGLMAVAGWNSRDMLDRYVRDTAARRAADEARALNLGDF